MKIRFLSACALLSCIGHAMADPATPSYIKVPTKVQQGAQYAVKWGSSDNASAQYRLVGESSGQLELASNLFSSIRSPNTSSSMCYKVRAQLSASNVSGYTSTECANFVSSGINTVAELKSALSGASSGDTVELAGRIVLSTSDLPLVLKAGVTLQGNNNELVVTGSLASAVDIALIEASSSSTVDNIVLTGLYLDDGFSFGTDGKLHGIRATGNPVTVTDSLITGFTYGVTASDNSVVTISRNQIENNYGNNLAYGVHLSGLNAAATVTNNVFEGNRHAIASNGGGNEFYTATNNTIEASTKPFLDHSFDIHGKSCTHGQGGCAPCSSNNVCHAGKGADIRDNTFNNDQPAIVIRGVPSQSVVIEGNTYTKLSNNEPKSSQEAFDANGGFYRGLCEDTGSTINGVDTLYVWLGSHSTLGSSKIASRRLPSVPRVFGQFDGSGGDDLIFTENDNHVRLMSFSMSGSNVEDTAQCGQLRKTPDSAFPRHAGNFSGSASRSELIRVKTDGSVQVYQSTGEVSNISAPFDNFETVSTIDTDTSFAMDNVLIGDFNGDGIDDLFRTQNNLWQVKTNADGAWNTIKTTSASDPVVLSQIKLGDLDGDGVTDVFYTKGGQWRWVKSGTAWSQLIKTSTVPASQVAIGNFLSSTGDEMFSIESGNWVATTRSGVVDQLRAASSDAFSTLMFADIDGNNYTDVLVYK